MSEKRPWAVYTMVREEHFFLTKWYEYYSRHVADCDMYIIHHQTSTPDDCTDFLKEKEVNIIPEYWEHFSSTWMNATTKKHQQELLNKYHAVIYTDVDEILFTDPRYFASLGTFMRAFLVNPNLKSVRVQGWSIYHQPDTEPDFDPKKPIVEQRGTWYRHSIYDKPLISKIPLEWTRGFHEAPGMGPKTDKVLMLHLHQYDFKRYIARHTRWATDYKPDQLDVSKNYHQHYRKRGEELERQYFRYVGSDHIIKGGAPIPDWVKSQVGI